MRGRSRAEPRGHGERVLYVDDEEPMVHLVAHLLKRLGYGVTGCTDPVQALQLFRARPHDFHAVVTDVSMPGMSGADLARELQQIRAGVPIVMISGCILPQDRETAASLGICDLILKPNTFEELGEVLHRVLTEKKGKAETALETNPPKLRLGGNFKGH